jgi:hypothetical protein
VAAKYGTKVEIFAMETDDDESQDKRAESQVNGAQKQDSNMLEEENKKVYTALLQN